jgi:hypothetical protein
LLRADPGLDHTPIPIFVGRGVGDGLVIGTKSPQQEDDIGPVEFVYKAKDALVLDGCIEKRGDVETGGVANVNVVFCVLAVSFSLLLARSRFWVIYRSSTYEQEASS